MSKSIGGLKIDRFLIFKFREAAYKPAKVHLFSDSIPPLAVKKTVWYIEGKHL